MMSEMKILKEDLKHVILTKLAARVDRLAPAVYDLCTHTEQRAPILNAPPSSPFPCIVLVQCAPRFKVN